MDDRLDLLLRALSDRTRRGLLDRLRDQPGQTLSELASGAPHSRQAVSKHLALLEDVELVVPVWRGREKRHYLNPAPLQALPARWVTASARQAHAAMDALRSALDHGGDGSDRFAAGAAHLDAAAPADTVAACLLAPPAPGLQGQPVLHDDTLAAARSYLDQTAEAVQMLLRQLPADQGYDRPAGGGFSLVEHLWHLSDIESLGWRPRFERILAETRPRLPGVDGDRLALDKQYQARPWRAAARHFVAERRRSLQALARFDAQVLRRPVHFAGERARAAGVVAAAVAHDLDHRPAMAERWLALKPG